MNKIPSFCHIAFHTHHNLYQDGLMISGFYNWPLVFGGNYSAFQVVEDKLNSYDIIFVGISPLELHGQLISQIRERLTNKNTKVVACVDYSSEMWQDPSMRNNPFNIDALRLELEKCDFIFSAETSMKSRLQALLPERTIHHFPHPTNIGALKALAVESEDKLDQAFYLIHRYDNNVYDMYSVARGVKGIKNVAICLDGNIMIDCLRFFKRAQQGKQYRLFIQDLAKARIVVDSYHKIHSYGRTPVECACLRTPIVSTDWVTSARDLWPKCTVAAGDIKAQQDMVNRLLSDQDFYNEVVEYAWNKVNEYDYESSYHNFMNMVNSKK